MLFINISLLLIIAFQEVYSELELAECRIVHDKYSFEKLGSRNLLGGKLWPSNTVPYKIGPGFSQSDLDVIHSAIKEIENKTCVKWIPQTDQRSYVFIKNNQRGCFAVLGYSQYRGLHVLNLQKYNGYSTCMTVGVAVHEMLHIMGYAHEQTRPDRDEYVKIHWMRIKRNAISNYFKAIDVNTRVKPPRCNPGSNATSFDNCYGGFSTETFGYPYDYGSIMHYGLKDFGTTYQNNMDTLQPIPEGVNVGQRKKMSDLDVLKINARYKCNQPSTVFPISTKAFRTTEKSECFDKNGFCSYFKESCTILSIQDYCPRTCMVCPDQLTTTTTKKPIPICFYKTDLCYVAKRYCN